MYRLNTKEKRLSSRNAEIESIKESKHTENFQTEVYFNDLTIVTWQNQVNEKRFYNAKVWRGDSGRPIINVYSKNPHVIEKIITDEKTFSDSRAKYREKKKEENKTSRYLTEAAIVSQRIKKELSEKYPEVKFSVRSENFAGGDAVRIGYFDSVPESEIQSLVSKYEAGHFNGMEDIYEYKKKEFEEIDGQKKEIPTVKYLTINRRISPEIKDQAESLIKRLFEISEHWISNAVYRLTVKMDLTKGFDETQAKNLIEKNEVHFQLS